MSYAAKLNPYRLKIFHEGKKRRIFVGELFYNEKSDYYEFTYDKHYAHAKNAIPISPDIDLFKLSHQSKKGSLFPSFIDRIPDRANPAYQDYCKSQGISVNEKNLIILLGSIGKRGPSNFVFEPVYDTNFSTEKIITSRKKLGITQHDFSHALGISKTTLQRIEAGKSRDITLLNHIEILLNFPEVALWQLKQTGCNVHRNVQENLSNYFYSLLSKK